MTMDKGQQHALDLTALKTQAERYTPTSVVFSAGTVLTLIAKIETLEAERSRPSSEGFTRDVLNLLWEGYTLDGSDIQELGLKHGVIVRTTFDPARHKDRHGVGAEEGDEWFVEALTATPRQEEAGEVRKVACDHCQRMTVVPPMTPAPETEERPCYECGGTDYADRVCLGCNDIVDKAPRYEGDWAARTVKRCRHGFPLADNERGCIKCGEEDRAQQAALSAAPKAVEQGEVAALLRRVVVYQIEGDNRIHVSIMGQHLEGWSQGTREAQALLRFDAVADALLNLTANPQEEVGLPESPSADAQQGADT